jgi:SAM-dependent methyltransferase
MNCPLCKSASRYAFDIRGFTLADCVACGHRFVAITADESHVASIYADEYFTGGGAGYADYSAEGKMLRERGRMYAQKIAPFVSGGRMLDVGAAAGYILKGFTDEGWTGVGIEPNENMASRGRVELSLDIHTGILETLELAERFNLVSMIQVAAHFCDPAAAFRRAVELLVPGGYLLIETWDRSSLMARVLGKAWHEYSPPSVLHWYTKRQLTIYLSSLGLERVKGGRPAKKINGAHVRSLLKYRIGDVRLLKLIPQNFDFPYPSEDLFWALYRKP